MTNIKHYRLLTQNPFFHRTRQCILTNPPLKHMELHRQYKTLIMFGCAWSETNAEFEAGEDYNGESIGAPKMQNLLKEKKQKYY